MGRAYHNSGLPGGANPDKSQCMTEITSGISSVLKEKRVFKPAREFARSSHIPGMPAYQKLRTKAAKNPAAFWAAQAKDLHWQKPFRKTLDWKFPFVRWFTGGKINACENAIDVHLATGRRHKAAIIWEAEAGEVRTLTYQGAVHDGLDQVPSLQSVVVLRRTCQETPMKAGRDLWWHEVVNGASTECKAEALDSEHPLFILYTSG
ncbi:hypothetical protein EB061_07025, partial [bacterium]|nr:hypothetical protein [bacterium]